MKVCGRILKGIGANFKGGRFVLNETRLRKRESLDDSIDCGILGSRDEEVRECFKKVKRMC